MSLSIGTPGSATYSESLTGIEQMMDVMPDNASNQITARNVRDVVLSLYEDIIGLSSSISTSLGSSSASNIFYNNLNPSSVTVGGIVSGTTFSNVSVQQMFDNMFYPYVQPTISITPAPTSIEFGNTAQRVILSWSIQAKKNNIVSANIFRPLNIPSPLSVGTPVANTNASGTLGSNVPILNTTTSFTFSVSDIDISVTPNTGAVYTTTCQVTWSLRRFWGTLPASSSLITQSGNTFSYSDVSTLSSELNSGYVQTRNITTNNDYVVFMWPTNVVDLSINPPRVSIGGFGNNDWTKTRNNVLFTNQYGYTASYDVWVFNYIQAPNTFTYVITT
jgi:hypothetical protein